MRVEKVVCTQCKNSGSVNTYQSINVSTNPELKDKVKDGSLFVWKCPNCGRLNLCSYKTLYHDPESKLMIWFLPEEQLSKEERQTIGQKIDSLTGDTTLDNELEGYTLRRVSDIGSLIEKVNIHDAGLNDVVIELCKYVTKLELAEKSKSTAKASSIIETPFKFFRFTGADNEIIFSFPEDGSMKCINVGFNVYEDCLGILQRNPEMVPGKGFSEIDATWISKFMR